MLSSSESMSPLSSSDNEGPSGSTWSSSAASSPTPVVSVPNIDSPPPLPKEEMQDGQEDAKAGVQLEADGEAAPPPPPHAERRVRALPRPIAPIGA